jgi:hypothetical protein
MGFSTALAQTGMQIPPSSHGGMYKPLPLVGLSKPAIFLQAILHVVVTEILAGFQLGARISSANR